MQTEIMCICMLIVPYLFINWLVRRMRRYETADRLRSCLLMLYARLIFYVHKQDKQDANFPCGIYFYDEFFLLENECYGKH